MILIGDNLVPYENIENIQTIEDIRTSKSNSTVCFAYNKEILEFCFQNQLSYAVKVSCIKEAIYCNALNTKYIIAHKKLAKDIQKLADNYIFDSKILALIQSNEEFEEIASNEIDGIIYKTIL